MLTLENISFDVKDEKGEKDIIKNLSLTIDDNKFVVITGPNGGGKSTLAFKDTNLKANHNNAILSFLIFKIVPNGSKILI